MRLPFVTRLLIVVFVVAELAVFIGAIRWLGGWAVFWLILATALFGGWIIRTAGVRAWSAASEAVRTGAVLETSGTGASFIGGALLVMPGFVTDLLGILTLLPVTRRGLAAAARAVLPGLPPTAPRPDAGWDQGRGPAAANGGQVIEGEIVDPEDEAPS